jgi:hypothetical protein
LRNFPTIVEFQINMQNLELPPKNHLLIFSQLIVLLQILVSVTFCKFDLNMSSRRRHAQLYWLTTRTTSQITEQVRFNSHSAVCLNQYRPEYSARDID